MQNANFNNLLANLKKDFSELNFVPGDRFYFHPPNTIFYNSHEINHANKARTKELELTLLHEIGHFLLGANDYQKDIELLKIEALAWAKAKSLCEKYGIAYDEDFAESKLDSYRDLLHINSLCPNCKINGYEDNSGLYHCPLCAQSWHPRFHAK